MSPRRPILFAFLVVLGACGQPPVQPGPDASGTEPPKPDSGVVLPLPDASVAEPPDAATPEPADASLPSTPDSGVPGTPCTTHANCADQQWCNWQTGFCEGCPAVVEPVCTDQPFVNEAPFGNGCTRKQCCYSGQDVDPRDGICKDIPLLTLANCPYKRVFECWIRVVNGFEDPLAQPAVTPLDYYDRLSFAIRNDGRAPLHFFEFGMSAASSPDLSISAWSLMPMVDGDPWIEKSGPLPTELLPGQGLVLQFKYAPTTDLTKDMGELVMHSDSNDGDDEWRIPVVGDSWSTSCTIEKVREKCVVGQRCTEAYPEYGPICEDCPQPIDPMCNGGRAIAHDPPGSYLCVAFTCECWPGDAYYEEGHTNFDGTKSPGCIPIVPCGAQCNDCRELCTTYPGGGPDGSCLPDNVVRACVDEKT